MKLSNTLLFFFAFAEGAQIGERSNAIRLRREGDGTGAAPADDKTNTGDEDNTPNEEAGTQNNDSNTGDENTGTGDVTEKTPQGQMAGDKTESSENTESQSTGDGDTTGEVTTAAAEVTTSSALQSTIGAALLLAVGQMLL
ncbi:Oidioi.mRNA.OKI2018_I69.XSR.g15140.t1.cds [Oikopleura dioica]|uniref:Oidioi.mRNA.OKI2018_I69.XSR.g15140.t1.cds n=1 Tax=Oikopleura dioica TaxID=34765 RepID=A0ABN7SH38_OIKDI|nr:Oidioi.mRNA.OKI2018_I69.XSR.g15140.t1.cds [Oikopleura dioica]